MKIENLNDVVVMKLIGPIVPVGETYEDGCNCWRYENLKQQCDLVDCLFNGLRTVEFRGATQGSL